MPAAYDAKAGIYNLKSGDILITDQSNTVSHCGICVGERNGHADYVIHAANAGLLRCDPTEWGLGSQVFRGVGLTKPEANAIEKIAYQIRESAAYGAARAFFKSWSGSSSFGSGARERLLKYRTRLASHQGVVKNVYCSELVILAYQLGLGEEAHRLFIKKDAKHTLPKTLREYLRQNATDWTEVGDYKA